MTAGYLCAVLLAVMFMLYLDGQIGVMMLAFLLLMPVISLLATLRVRKRISLTLTAPDTASKQKAFDAVLRLSKRTRLPVPFLRMQFTADAHFAPLIPGANPLPAKPVRGSSSYRREMRLWRFSREAQLVPETLPLCLSAGTETEAEYRIRIEPRFCGRGILSAEEVILSDFLGMFRFRLKNGCRTGVTVMPEIPEIKAGSALFRAVSDTVSTADEESEATPNFSASAQPGYEHRDYIPGDSLKRINWKLSTKRHHLMVRQDEPVALARLSVVLDFRRPQNGLSPAEQLAAEEQLTETALGFVMLCAKYGFPCELSYPDAAGSWSTLPIDNAGQLETEAVTMLEGGFRDRETLSAAGPLPPDTERDAGILLLYFTVCPDAETAEALETLRTACNLITPQRFAADAVCGKRTALWLVTPDRRLITVEGEG